MLALAFSVSAVAEGSACTLFTRLWLSGSHVYLPVREVRGEGYATFKRLDGTSNETYFPAPWDNGLWGWSENERVTPSIPVPCDTVVARVSLNYQGVSLWGSPVKTRQGGGLRITR